MSSSPPQSRSTTPHNELLTLTHQLTPSKTPRTTRQICEDIQAITNEAIDSHGAVKRKLADVTNQLGSTRPPRKRRLRNNRADEAPAEVKNPTSIEERTRGAGRHFVIESGLFLFTDIHALLETDEDPNFDENTEFDSEVSRIQGQLRDVIALLPQDARLVRKEGFIADSFNDGMGGQRSTINTRLRHESLAHIIDGITFQDGDGINVKDFDSSSSRFNAFAERIGYQAATDDADAFYTPLKAEVLFEDYDGTMNIDKVFRGPVLLKIRASIIRGPQGAKGLFEGKSRLPSAQVIQRLYTIEHTTPAAIAICAVLAIWLFSADTQIVPDGDETKIDYKFLFQTFLRQICEGLRDEADWALGLFRHWDAVLFPNAEHSYGQAASANRQAVHADIDAMDAAFKAAAPPRDGSHPPDTTQAQASTSTAQQDEPEPHASTQPDEPESPQPARTSPPATRGHGRRRTRSRRH
ncbi:hypothetical protein C8R45DRAFT_1100559 [Mycena sanguinolenta]|nr:hypothetical protein C8R45DRAFT_1100559 [Mycena sanguinolenta]